MKKGLFTLIFLLFITGISYAKNSFFDGLKSYLNQEVEAAYTDGEVTIRKSGKLLKIFDDGILIKDGKDMYFINKQYIIFVEIDR